jgi:hypothetical protein
LLAQKLALEIFEGEAIAIANEIPAVARRQMRRRRTVSETEFRRRVCMDKCGPYVDSGLSSTLLMILPSAKRKAPG